MTTTQDAVLVELEGQQHWVKPAIAEDDELLRQLLSTLNPALAEAEIERGGNTIKVIPRKGTKGSKGSPAPLPTTSILVCLDAAKPDVDPAMLMCLKLQQTEITEGLSPQRASEITQQIEAAMQQSRLWQRWVKRTLEQLDAAKPRSLLPHGF